MVGRGLENEEETIGQQCREIAPVIRTPKQREVEEPD